MTNEERLAKRFWARVERRGEGECWLWTGPRFGHGYGSIWVTEKGNHEGAHRASWLLHNGPIPPGLCVCHKCDNPACVNPAHLWLGTRADNNHDRDRKGRHVRGGGPNPVQPPGELHWAAKLSTAQALEIRSSTETSLVLAKRYGVNPSTIQRIKNGQRWKVLSPATLGHT